jgi:hypothetical protein
LKKIYLLLLLLISINLKSQIVFETITGDTVCYEEAFSAVATINGYTVSANYNCNFGVGNFKSSLLFLDENGDSLNQINGMPFNGWMKQDGIDLIFAGGNKAGLVYDSIIIAKANSIGGIIWTKKYRLGECNNVVYDMAIVNDGYLFCGFYSVAACTNAVYDAFVLKLNKNGNEQWLTPIRAKGNQQFYSVKKMPDNTIAAFGWTESATDSLGKFFLVQFNASGDSLSSFIIDEPGDFRGHGMDITNDGHFIFSGTQNNNVVIYKTDYEGKIRWKKNLGQTCGSSYYKSIFTADRQYLFTYLTSGAIGCFTNVLKTDTASNVLWEKTLPAVIRSVTEPQIGSFLLSGFRLRPGNFVSDVYVARFDTTYSDTSTSIVNEETTAGSIKVFPNPANENIFIEIDDEKSLPLEIEFYDLTGKRILKQSIIHKETAIHIERLNLSTSVLFIHAYSHSEKLPVLRLIIEN